MSYASDMVETTNPMAVDDFSCEPFRQTIEGVEWWFARLETVPMPEDSDYDERQNELSLKLNEATQAYENRPEGCEMEALEDDRYKCHLCEFSCHITTNEDI